MPKWPCRYIIWLSYLVYRCSINIYNFFSNCGCYTDEQTKVIRSYDIFSPNVYFAWVAHFGASKEEGALCHAHIRAHNTILQHKEVLLIGKNHLLSKLTTINTDFFCPTHSTLIGWHVQKFHMFTSLHTSAREVFGHKWSRS